MSYLITSFIVVFIMQSCTALIVKLLFVLEKQTHKKKLDKNGFVVSNVGRRKNIVQRIRHYAFAQNILNKVVLKEIYRNVSSILQTNCKRKYSSK